MSENEMFDRDQVMNVLGNGVARITFTKKDGSIREMTCTRDLSIIQEEHHPKGVKETPGDALPVFDLDLNEWRSFAWDSLTEVL